MNNVLTYSQVRIDCPYPLQTIHRLAIKSRLNDHSQLIIQGILREEEQDNCIQTATANDSVRIYEINPVGEDTLLFSGIVTELNVRCEHQTYHVEIHAMSYTTLMDKKVKSRSFQDISATYKEIIDNILTDYTNASYIQIPADHPAGSLIVQYQETDWSFVKRLATHFNTQLIPQDLGTGPRFWLGIRQTTPKPIESILNYTEINDTKAYRHILSHNLDVAPWSFTKYEINSNTRLNLGESVIFQDKPCIVEQATASFIGGLFAYTYTLGHETGIIQPTQSNHKLKGVSLLGSVLDTQNTSIKIHLRIDAAQEKTSACWLPYAAQSNNVFYCMPEIGENISLYFPQAEESSSIAVNAVRRNGGNCSKTSKPNTKYLAIPSGQEIKLSPQNIDVSWPDSLNITLDDASGITIHSNDNIIVSAGGKLNLNAQEKIKIIAKSGNIVAGSGADGSLSQLALLSGMTGDTHIKSADKIYEEGRVKEPFPDQLNQAIAYEEKKLDWGKLALA